MSVSRSKAISGWNDDELGNGNNQNTSRSARRRDMSMDFDLDNPIEEKTQKKVNRREFNSNQEGEEEAEIPEIPDLEDAPEPSEDLAFKVAEAPE